METIQILFKNIFLMIFTLFKNQSHLAIENLALRQQLSIYHHSKQRPKIHLRHRLFVLDFYITVLGKVESCFDLCET